MFAPNQKTGRPALLLLILSTALTGCGGAESSIALTEDEILRRERGAIEELKESGCYVTEAADQWLDTSGVMVRIFPEHVEEHGHIRKDVFQRFRHLRTCFLVLDATPITNDGLSDLRKLDNLLLLSVRQTEIDDEGLSQIEGIVSIRLLRLNHTNVTNKGLRHIDRMPDLIMLYLTGTKITDDALDHLRPLKKLVALKLSETDITDTNLSLLEGFPDLQYLALESTDITDKGVKSLKKLDSLAYVNLTDTDISPAGLLELRQALPNCEVEKKLTYDELRKSVELLRDATR